MMIGRRLVHYEVREKIGSGGMGDVFLARDTKLERDVALKVLPSHLAADGERRARLQREAKAIAALNHPNIVTVFSVEEIEGLHFLTMELVRGETLAAGIPKRGVELSKFFEIATRLTDAVASAHEASIVHRDLKPANVMVTEDGLVKVLDFGLARAAPPVQVEGDSESPTAVKTEAGVLAGTLLYMSPEQAEAKTVDGRSDVFSLGVILYEMLTGQRPFGGESAAAILSAILKDEPVPVEELRPGLSASLARVVCRCLAKDRKRRYQNARDLLLDLEACRDEERSPGDAARTAGGAPVSLWLGLVALAALGGYVLGANATKVPRNAVLRLSSPVQVTFEEGVERSPEWSPDESTLAYESSRSRVPESPDADVWVVQLGGQPVNRTADHEGDDVAPSWSLDGRELAFLSDRDGDAGVFVMSPLGGAARKIGVLRASDDQSFLRYATLQWLAGGDALGGLAPGKDGIDVAVILTPSTGEVREVALPGRRTGRIHARWSPDEQYLAYIAALAESNETTQLWVLRMSDGEATAITDGMSQDLSPSWSSDSRHLYFVSNRRGVMDLWQQSMESGKPDGEPERVTIGIGMREAVLSRDGTRMAYVKGQRVANLYRVPILEDRPAMWLDAEQLTFDEAYIEFVDVAPDGSRLVVSSNRSGNQDLWTLPAEGGAMLQLTTDRSPDWDPHWSPDGKEIAFYSNRSGNRDVWIVPTAGGAARQITKHEAADLLVSWSPDGSELVFSSDRGGTYEAWVISSEGGEPRVLSPGFRTAWSPSGQFIAMDRVGGWGIWRVPAEGGDAERLGTTSGRAPKWARDERHIFFLNSAGSRSDIWRVDVKSHEERAMTDLAGRPGSMSASALATDGKYLYFAWGSDTGDLWVMDVVP